MPLYCVKILKMTNKSPTREKKIGDLIQQRLSKYEALSRPAVCSGVRPPCHSVTRSWSYDENEIKTRNMHISERMRENLSVRNIIAGVNVTSSTKQESGYVRGTMHASDIFGKSCMSCVFWYFIVHDGLVYFEFYSILSLINNPPPPLSPSYNHPPPICQILLKLCNLVKACIPSKTELLQCLFILQLHLAALTSLKGEIIELNNRLHHVTSERDILEKQVNRLQVCILFVKIGQNVTASTQYGQHVAGVILP